MFELPPVNNNLFLLHVNRFLKANNDCNRKKFRGLRPSTPVGGALIACCGPPQTPLQQVRELRSRTVFRAFGPKNVAPASRLAGKNLKPAG